MARLLGPKCRICRREGAKLFLKGERCMSPKCPLEKKGAVPPGLHGIKMRRKKSDYGKQLREKQKAKRSYEILERQFKKYFSMASKVKGATGEVLLSLLERRFDNVLYRMGLVGDRTSARQLINHGHVLLNGKKNNIPSTLLNKDDVIAINPKALSFVFGKKSEEEKNIQPPAWLERKGPAGKIISLPKRDEIDSDINEQLIVEFYSR